MPTPRAEIRNVFTEALVAFHGVIGRHKAAPGESLTVRADVAKNYISQPHRWELVSTEAPELLKEPEPVVAPAPDVPAPAVVPIPTPVAEHAAPEEGESN